MLFTKKKKRNLEPNGFTKATFEDKKIKLANWLSHKTSGYSPLQKKIGLFIFCIATGAAGILTTLFFRKVNAPDSLVPRESIAPSIREIRPAVHAIVSKADFTRIEEAKKILDSLRKHDSVKFNQIMILQPGLMENIKWLESIYQSQKK